MIDTDGRIVLVDGGSNMLALRRALAARTGDVVLTDEYDYESVCVAGDLVVFDLVGSHMQGAFTIGEYRRRRPDHKLRFLLVAPLLLRARRVRPETMVRIGRESADRNGVGDVPLLTEADAIRELTGFDPAPFVAVLPGEPASEKPLRRAPPMSDRQTDIRDVETARRRLFVTLAGVAGSWASVREDGLSADWLGKETYVRNDGESAAKVAELLDALGRDQLVAADTHARLVACARAPRRLERIVRPITRALVDLSRQPVPNERGTAIRARRLAAEITRALVDGDPDELAGAVDAARYAGFLSQDEVDQFLGDDGARAQELARRFSVGWRVHR